MHTRAMLLQMLPDAERLVARGAERLRAQEARVVALKNKGLLEEHSRKLLQIMKQTQELQVEHVELLKRELAATEHGVQLRTGPSAADNGNGLGSRT